MTARGTIGGGGAETGAGAEFLRSTVVVSVLTGASRSLGFAREILMAVLFGTSLAKSAFDVAFRIPNLFRRLFGEGALAAAFIPTFTESLEHGGREEANRLASSLFTMLGVTLAVIVGGGVTVVTLVMRHAELGVKAAAVLPLLRIMLPYMFFICLVALCMAVLNSFRHFALPAFTPVLLNVIWIAALLWWCPKFGDTAEARIYGVAWGVLAAGVVQLAVQLPALAHFGIRPRLSLAWTDARVKRVLLLMGPAAVGMGIHQLNVCIDGLLALWAAPWAPAALTFAERLVYLPLGLFATALGTVLLPTFSRQAARAAPESIVATMRNAVSSLMVVMIPACAGLMALAKPVVELVFEWQGGLFDGASTVRTARALQFYAPGLIVFSLYKILTPAFYALKDTRTPVRVGVSVVGLNLALNILFVLTWPPEMKHAGLALATVAASGVNCLVLARILDRRLGPLGWAGVAKRAAGPVAAAAAMSVVAASVCGLVSGRVPPGKLAQLTSVAAAMAAGGTVYVGLAGVLCRKELKRVLRARKGGRS